MRAPSWPGRWKIAKLDLRTIALLFPLLSLPLEAGNLTPGGGPPAEMLRPVTFQKIKIRGFWGDQIKRLTTQWIPHCIRQMEPGGQGQELLNLVNTAKLRRGEAAGKFTGLPWSDAYVYNTIEAMCLALSVDPEGDRELEDSQAYLRKKLDEWIPIVLAAQMEDGYIHSFHLLNRRKRYTDIRSHEFYVQGYFLEAGVAHCRFTAGADRRLYDAAKRCGDHLSETFGPTPKRNWIHGHPGMGYALCRLARLVDEVEGAGKGDKYVRVAKFLFDHRHTDPGKRSAYQQSHLPVVEQSQAVGHAVRATYFYTGIADLAMLTADDAYRRAVDRIWESAIHRKLYITGGVGASHQGEAFGPDFELPNGSAYCESCAGCGLSFWSDRMARMRPRGDYVDVAERVLYNNILGAIELTGRNFFYQNPLGSERHRYAWHGCPCCVGNIPRALIAVKDLMYARNPDKDILYIHHFVSSEGTIDDVAGTSLKIEQRTEYPWRGDVTILLTPRDSREFTVRVRVPDRGESTLYTPKPSVGGKLTFELNGEARDATVENGYMTIKRRWSPGDRIDITLPMDIQRIYADERVEDDRGRVALQRGPIVYNIEDADHGGQSRSVVLSPDTPLRAVWKEDLLGGVMVIEKEEGKVFAVPNYARLNREGWSQVWIPERPELAAPRIEPTIASTSRVTTSFRTSEGRFSTRAIHDQKEPEKSDERNTPLFHWWPHLGTVEWVQYEFEKSEKASAVEVYWYDDRAWGACRVPASWRVLYRDGEQWRPVEGARSYGVELDEFNRVTFDPVTTSALRLEVQLQEGQSAGILEWRVE